MKFRYSVFVALLSLTFSYAHAQATSPVEVVETMEKNAGVHHGFRRNHAKGFCATGEFQATPDAKALSRSPLFSGKSFPVVARFSEPGGVPEIPDNIKIPRGLALQFSLSDGVLHNMSMLNAPVFVVATPDDFLESLKAGSPDLLKAFMAKHPESKPFFAFVMGNNPPASYATAPYNSLNAFKFINSGNKEQFVRWQFVPAAGDVKLTDAEFSKVDANYLETEFKTRVAKAPVEWTMVVTLAEKGDSLLDPTKAWPANRKKVKVGTLKLSKYEPQAGGVCEKINFDPTHVSDGVAISDDPILQFRSPAYAISFGKRLSDPVDAKPAK